MNEEKNKNIGIRVNSLVITKYIGLRRHGKNLYHFFETVCDCGKKTDTVQHQLFGKRKKHSCGCLKMKAWGKFIAAGGTKTHGKSNSSIYRRWRSMLDRCQKPSSEKWSRYGGRGISVCDRWKNFKLFYEDMGDPPSEGLSIDRIDVNGNYEPKNCRWANQKTQQNNRANNRRIEFQGECLPVTEWARRTGISSKVIRQRIDRDKMTPEEALSRWNRRLSTGV